MQFVNGRIIGSNHRAAEETLPQEIIDACPCHPDSTDELPWGAHGNYLACVRGFLVDASSLGYSAQEVKQYKKVASSKDCGSRSQGGKVPKCNLEEFAGFWEGIDVEDASNLRASIKCFKDGETQVKQTIILF